jgi:YVTN family beta-propeller protein
MIRFQWPKTNLRAVAALAFASLSLAAAGNAATLLVANKGEATLSLVDLARGAVVATLPTGEGPHEVAVSPEGRHALVANYGGREPGSSLTLIDVPGARLLATIDLEEHRRPHGVVWLDGRRALVTSEESHALLLVDTVSKRVTAAYPTGQEVSHMVAAAPGGRRAFVANIGSGSVTVLDLRRGERVAVVETGEGAEGIAVAAGGDQVWVTNRAADTVTVLDAHTLEKLATLPSKGFPIRAEAASGDRVLVSHAATGDLSVFSTTTLQEVKRVDLGVEAADPEDRLFGDRFGDSSVPIGIEVTPDRVYVAHANADVISEHDAETLERLRLIRAGKEPDGMAWSPVTVEGAER